MINDFINILEKKIKAKQLIMEDLNTKLDIAIIGLKAIISEGSDNLNIAQKTLDEIDNIKLK